MSIIPPPPGEDPACPNLRSTKIAQQATLDSLTGQLEMARTGLVLNQRLARLDDPEFAPIGDFEAPWVQGRLDALGADPMNAELVVLYGQILAQLAIIATVPGQIAGVQSALQGTVDQMQTKGCQP